MSDEIIEILVEELSQQQYVTMLTDRTIAGLIDAVQELLDDTAKTRGYDSILSACTYATSSHQKFSTEGQACVDWRDACWSHCYDVMAQVQLGTRAIPTPAELLAELPAINW